MKQRPRGEPVNITTDEISAVWDSLDLAVRQAVFIAVLEQRNIDLKHTVEVLERAVQSDRPVLIEGQWSDNNGVHHKVGAEQIVDH